MKTLWLLPITLVSLALAVVAAPVAARVGSVRGEVQLVRNGQPTALKSGIALQAGDTLITGDGAEAHVTLSEPAGELILSPGAELRFDKLSSNHTGIESILDATIILSRGDLRGAIGRLSDLSKFEIGLGPCRYQVGVGKSTRFALSADGTLRVRSGCTTSFCEGKPGFSVCGGEKFIPTLGLTVAMTPPELASSIWEFNPTPTTASTGYSAQNGPQMYVNPLIGAGISTATPPLN